MKEVPSLRKTSFSCPHCGAFAHHDWYGVLSCEINSKDKKPVIISRDDVSEIMRACPDVNRESLGEWFEMYFSGLPFFDHDRVRVHPISNVTNLNISECFSCKKIAVWVGGKVAFPDVEKKFEPVPDMPDRISALFREAATIVDKSPRGAAALLRLAIQYLCIALDEKGKNIDEDIASLVTKGLDPMVQKALDVVRVVGNEAVHPGEIDLDDNREVAEKLFDLLNIIVTHVITRKKDIDALYGSLPARRLQAIEARNAKAEKKRDDV